MALGVLALVATVAVAAPASAAERVCLNGELTGGAACVTAARIVGGMEYFGDLKDDQSDDRMTNLYIRLWGEDADGLFYLRMDHYQIQENGWPAPEIEFSRSHQLPVKHWEVELCSRLHDEAETDCVESDILDL